MKNTNSVTVIRDRMQNCGEALAAEHAELEAATQAILAPGGKLTNKTLIMYVIRELEREQDAQRQAVLRNVLELVVTHTPDDAGGQAV
ncbi:biofilm development regulator YmgB/AriR family protein [Type-D symbiont of Plautia stali]|uniref:biofilm development regulator YmgB/AriR family protein n=1 Tax=Type-D symbiont of Plautia stali TaxID=1560356 RepID=UPI00073EF902|nr:biofilm development regulator YmgB/AriR family protein [Type-D symbiont of Plautia stali]